ncbi:HNH endonuclease family protein [Mycolicibacterium goodii]|uniref:HNH endonuclease family protein n=1 Tax=Mycolicibacterium goodii TaxID=134601 RepID=UPI00256F25FB|nr:HNH endonuclease family protein [Mycolicibacterium goodii]
MSSLLSQVRVVDRIEVIDGYERGCGTDKKTRAKQACVFGPAWNDPLDHSGCDTRSRLLAQSLRNVSFKPGTRNCKPIAGILSPDPYTGADIDLKDVEVDHVYALSRAWNAGAWRWSSRQRQIFANDMTELVAVSRAANRTKSDAGLDEWMPAYQPCTYARRYLTVAIKYQLPITVGDQAAAIAACR